MCPFAFVFFLCFFWFYEDRKRQEKCQIQTKNREIETGKKKARHFFEIEILYDVEIGFFGARRGGTVLRQGPSNQKHEEKQGWRAGGMGLEEEG